MKRNGTLLAGLAVAGLVGLSAGVQAASTGGSTEFPVVSGKGALTVSGNGYWHRESYSGGEQPVLSAYDGEGRLLPDGEYQYEFKSYPQGGAASARQRPQLSGAAPDRPASNPAPVQTVSGSFVVQGGQLILQ